MYYTLHLSPTLHMFQRATGTEFMARIAVEHSCSGDLLCGSFTAFQNEQLLGKDALLADDLGSSLLYDLLYSRVSTRRISVFLLTADDLIGCSNLRTDLQPRSSFSIVSKTGCEACCQGCIDEMCMRRPVPFRHFSPSLSLSAQ